MMGFRKARKERTRFSSTHPTKPCTHCNTNRFRRYAVTFFLNTTNSLPTRGAGAPASTPLEIVVKALMFATILSLGGPFVQGATAQHGPIARGFDTTNTLSVFNVRFEAPVGHRQPSVAEIDLGKTAREFRSPAPISADEAFRRSEEALRKKLIICNC